MSDAPPAAASGSATGAGTRPPWSGRGRGRNRGHRRGGRNRSDGTARPAVAKSKFKGETEEMNGHVYQCYDEQDDRRQYSKMTEILKGHVKKTMRYPEDLAPLFADPMEAPTIAIPAEPGTAASLTEKTIWAEELKEYVKRMGQLKNNLAAIFAIVWGQCSEEMRAKIKSSDFYADRAANNNCVWLLNEVKAITMQFDEKRNSFLAIMDARASFATCKQEYGQTVEEYVETIKGWADTVEHQGGTVSENYEMVSDTESDGTARSKETRKKLAKERTLAIAIIRGADATRYGTLIDSLANDYAMGRDHYPMTTTAAYNILVSYKTPANSHKTHRAGNPAPQTVAAPAATAPEASAMTFAQRSVVPGRDGQTHNNVTCYVCQNLGHFAPECPNGSAGPAGEPATTTGTTLFQYGYMLTQSDLEGLDPNWVLLDSQSTVSVFRNPKMLSNIRKSPTILRAITNGGHQDSQLVGDFPNLGEVWYNDKSIANILSLAHVMKVCRVTMDTEKEPALLVHRKDGSIMRFSEHKTGLFVFDSSSNSNTSEPISAYSFISTVANQKKMFTRRQIADADLARSLYRKCGRPSEAQFQNILEQHFIRNCPVTPDDAKRALIIYGPDVATLKGKTTRDAAAHRVPTFEAVPLPAPILEHHSNVTLCVDFLFVQGMPFVHTISRNIGFRTVSAVPNRSKATILLETRAAIQLYTARGLHVRDVHADAEFECIRHDILPVEMDIVPPDVHVGEVERSIRVVKERMRCTVHGLPFKRLPRLLVREIVSDAVRCLNQFPGANGISDTMSPTGIITGCPFPDYHNMRLELGAYAQVFEDEEPTNTPRSRSLGAIALTPTGNAQGAYYFMSLATGRRISRHQWTELPITEAAIARVEALALHKGQPLIQDSGLVVEWRHNQIIDDDEYDQNFQAPVAALADDPLIGFEPLEAAEAADLVDEPAELLIPPNAPPLENDGGAGAQGVVDENANEDANENEAAADDEDDDHENQPDDDETEAVITDSDDNHSGAHDGEPADEGTDGTGDEDTDDASAPPHNYNLRRNIRAPVRFRRRHHPTTA